MVNQTLIRIAVLWERSGGYDLDESLPLGNKPDPLDELFFIILTTMTQYGPMEVFDDLKRRFPSWEMLLNRGAEANLRDDRVGYKIREASLQKIPYALVVGAEEESGGTVNVRSRDRGEIGEMALEGFLQSIAEERVGRTATV